MGREIQNLNMIDVILMPVRQLGHISIEIIRNLGKSCIFLFRAI